MVRLHSPSTPSKSEGLILRSPAKLNLFLQILAKRKDSYHNIKTIFERISLFDTLIFKLRADGKIKVICDNAAVPEGKGNLVYRAAALLQKRLRVKEGVWIKIIKRIPIGAGLGGGSSNAAYTLLGLNRLWGLELSKKSLINFAKALGSDVAFFIHDCPFAIGEGRGEIITPLKGLKKLKLWHVLVVPRLSVLTPLIYKKWDQNQRTFKLTPPFRAIKKSHKVERAGLTTLRSDVKILISMLRNKSFSLLSLLLLNDLEKITLRLYPEVASIKNELAVLGPKSILMSGSGPAVFSVVSSRKEAVSLCRKIKGEHKSWRILAARTF